MERDMLSSALQFTSGSKEVTGTGEWRTPSLDGL